MSINSFKQYLMEIGQYPLLSAEEELELGRRIAEGDEAARERLINCNLRLVISIAKNYQNNHLTLPDLVSEGNMGLVTAVDKYDYTLGYRFSTCATPWIKQAIGKAITDHGRSIRIPAHIYSQLAKLRKVQSALALAGNLHPTAKDIAREMDITEDKASFLLKNLKDAISLDMPLGDDNEGTLIDLQEDTGVESPVEYANRVDREYQIQRMLARYPERTQIIMKMRFGLGKAGEPDEYCTEHTLEEIGAYLGITRERVRQIEKETLADMKNHWGNSKKY